MKTIALLPARLASARLPEKMLADLCGKPLIVRTWEAVVATGLFHEVLIVTDHSRILEAAQAHGAQVCLSRPDHPSGSDRLAEVVAARPDVDVVVNVQGDEPFTSKQSLSALLACFNDPLVQVASACCRLETWSDYQNPNVVKVVKDVQGDALYFSRAPIPFDRDQVMDTAAEQPQGLAFTAWQHLGLYAYRREALLRFTSLPPAPIELTEKLEQLRLLHHGMRIRMAEVTEKAVGVDTAADLEKARALFTSRAGK